MNEDELPEIEDLLAVKNAEITALKAENARMKASIKEAYEALAPVRSVMESNITASAILQKALQAPAAPQEEAKELEGKVKIIMNGKVRGYLDTENALSMLIDLYGGEEKANAPLEAVTLSEDALGYLARTACPDGYFTDFLPVPSHVQNILRFSYAGSGGFFNFYRLADEYNTGANRAAIEARRKELGL